MDVKEGGEESKDPKRQKARNYPMPKEINYYMLQNYGLEFYGAKHYADKLKILETIRRNLQNHGFPFTVSEIERRLKNMKSHYRRKKEDMGLGVAQKIDWEYFNTLDDIFTKIAKEDEKKSIEFAATSVAPLQPTTMNASSITRETQATESPQNQSVNQEKIETNDFVESDNSDEPAIKRTKVLEFDNFKEVASQLPIHSVPENNAKSQALSRLIHNIKVVDQARLALDEERLKLEIRRNELDKLGYQLSDVLYKLINS